MSATYLTYVDQFSEPYTGLADWYVDLPEEINLSGFFEFYLQYEEGPTTHKSSIHTFNVEPILRVNGRILK